MAWMSSAWRWVLIRIGLRVCLDVWEGQDALSEAIVERSTLAIRPRALRKEPPIDSHRWRASFSPPRPQGFDPGTSSL
eukprot:953122-Pelagomonas_calceolata.AAC.1